MERLDVGLMELRGVSRMGRSAYTKMLGKCKRRIDVCLANIKAKNQEERKTISNHLG